MAKARVLGSSLEAADQKSSLRSWVPAQKIRVAILRAGTQGKATESPPEKKRGRTRGEITSVQGLTDEPLNCGPSDDFVTSLDRYLGTPRRILRQTTMISRATAVLALAGSAAAFAPMGTPALRKPVRAIARPLRFAPAIVLLCGVFCRPERGSRGMGHTAWADGLQLARWPGMWLWSGLLQRRASATAVTRSAPQCLEWLDAALSRPPCHRNCVWQGSPTPGAPQPWEGSREFGDYGAVFSSSAAAL